MQKILQERGGSVSEGDENCSPKIVRGVDGCRMRRLRLLLFFMPVNRVSNIPYIILNLKLFHQWTSQPTFALTTLSNFAALLPFLNINIQNFMAENPKICFDFCHKKVFANSNHVEILLGRRNSIYIIHFWGKLQFKKITTCAILICCMSMIHIPWS